MKEAQLRGLCQGEHGERTVLTKPKILCVPIVWLREEVSKVS